MRKSKLEIAVIGAGVSGIVSSYLLQRRHRVTLYEKNAYFGGHTNTIVIDKGPDAGTPVDTGFIVLNKKTYPNFLKFLDQLGVRIARTDMSFGYYCRRTGLAYATRNLNTIFAQRKNCINPVFWKFLMDMTRFIRSAKRDYDTGRLSEITLGDYLNANGYSENVVRQFVVPMAAAIWSASDLDIMDFPMRAFAQFYNNHGLLAVKDHPPWYYVLGGSHTYVRAFLKGFEGEVVSDCEIRGVRRIQDGVQIELGDGSQRTFDCVVIACHADEAYQILRDPSEAEIALLSQWRYAANRAVLHTDPSLMPPDKRAWASWNYVRDPDSDAGGPVTVTYHMNRLQCLRTQEPYFVTLNPGGAVAEKHIVKDIAYTHPVYNFSAFATQPRLSELNGERNTYYCGSYFGYGFHEDGVRSATAVADHFGIGL